MEQMLKKIRGDKIYCGLDIGSQRLKACLVRVVDSHSQELIGVYEAKTSGFCNASVSDLGLFTECIHHAITGLTQKTGTKFKELHVGIGGDLISKRLSSTVIPLLDRGNKVVGNHDIRKINNQAKLLGVKVEEQIINDFPQFYRVDDVNTALNPLGLLGRKLEVKTLLIVSNITRIQNITKAIHQAGYDVASLSYNSYAASFVSLDARLRKNGCVLIDIGAKLTDVLIFKNNMLKYIDMIPFGGDDVTHCIARNLNLPFDLAEDLKMSYAVAIDSDPLQQEDILVKKQGEYVPIKRQDICQAILPEVDQLSELIKESIERSGIRGQVNEGIVMVGGCSLLSGLLEKIEMTTNLHVALGRVNLGHKNLNNAAIFSAAVGLAQLGAFSTSSVNGHSSKAKNLLNRMKELYQEYF
jgi:cell division protein FtsA